MPTQRIVLAEYFTTDDVTLLFGVRADWEEPEVVEIKQPLAEIRKYVSENFSLEEPKEGERRRATISKVRSLDENEWQARFAPFIEPILKWADPGDYLYLVPHDVLHYLPLHALKVDGTYLIERNPVLYTPSASVLKYCQAKRKGRRETALVLGDSDTERPLPYAYVEALKVAETFGTEAYLGQGAQRSLVKEKLKQERDAIDILHFACHGYFHPVQALKSGILMAPASDQQEKGEFETTLQDLPLDRYLTAEEFFGMEMRADLVTLSACESGVNQLRPGDELFGLMRALIYAGTPSVIMSLWAVDEISSSILMDKFYDALKSGKTKVEALQSAQLEVKNMSAAEAISYCEDAAARLEQAGQQKYRRQVLRDIADLRFQAKDYTAAKIAYEALLADPEADEKEDQFLAAAVTRCNLVLTYGNNPDYTRRVFDRLFRWAPFVLIGDWK